LIYQSSNQDKYWDGQYKGKNISDEGCTYQLQYEPVFRSKTVIDSRKVVVIRVE